MSQAMLKHLHNTENCPPPFFQDALCVSFPKQNQKKMINPKNSKFQFLNLQLFVTFVAGANDVINGGLFTQKNVDVYLLTDCDRHVI